MLASDGRLTMPRAPRGKRVVDAASGSFIVAGRAPNGQAAPYFDKSRNVWVAPWTKPDGKVGRPTGRTRALAEASRARHVAEAVEVAKFGRLKEGFHADSTLAELMTWWLEHVARHRVRGTTFATYRKQLRQVEDRIGGAPVRSLRPEQVTTLMSDLVDAGSVSRARNIRTLLVQVLEEAVKLGLASENVAKKVRSPRVPHVQKRTLTPPEVSKLVASCEERYSAVVALCYVQGWRVSEALGLAWQDLDLDGGVVALRRGSTYEDGVGMVLGPTKTLGTSGRQMLSPTVIERLKRRRAEVVELKAEHPELYPSATYQGETIDLVFTNADGRPMLRQHIDRAIRVAAVKAGLDPEGLGTHTGRRSVVTNLYASGSLDIADVARFVGHSDVATTRGYVQHEGERPRQVSEKAFQLLDPASS
jgi:integrase